MDAHPKGKSRCLSDDPPPLIIVEGFLGGLGNIVGGSFEKHLNLACEGRPRNAIFASVGPVSSLHDRACELFYAIMGGTVDYGEEHASTHKQARYGRTNSSGLYPQWSRERPLHFLGHSMGGPTIVRLQWLISQGFFGKDMHPNMILSMTSVCAPFRGTPLTYTLGSSTTKAPLVRPLSLGSLLTKAVHFSAYLSPFLPAPSSFYLLTPFDMHTDARHMSLRDISLGELVRQLYKSDWAESRDVAPWDVTFESVDTREQEKEGIPSDGTYYRSYVCSMTKRASPNSRHHKPTFNVSQILCPALYVTSRTLGAFDYSVLRPAPSFFPRSSSSLTPSSASISGPMLFPSSSEATSQADYDVEQGLRVDQKVLASVKQADIGEEYWENDGVVPVFSQWHPHRCGATRCRHYDATKMKSSNVESGIWHVHIIDEGHHASLLPFWLGTPRQRAFWEDLGDWLRRIDARG